jgi:hypothetical protein
MNLKEFLKNQPRKRMKRRPVFMQGDINTTGIKNSQGQYESEELAKVADDKLNDTNRRSADKLEVGDVVEITGNVNFHGQTGQIVRFGPNHKDIVVVNLYNGGEHPFHSSDVSEADLSHEEEERKEAEENDKSKFYVAFYDTDEERSWIGMVTKEHGGKWHEKSFKGKPERRWGQTYMSYLTPDDVMGWIHKDYSRSIEIEGPFFDAKEAEDYVKENWGRIEEAVKKADKKKKLIQPVKSIADLRQLAKTDKRYEQLAIISAQNLGGTSKTLDSAIQWLLTNAMETDEKAVVDEINFCRDLVEESFDPCPSNPMIDEEGKSTKTHKLVHKSGKVFKVGDKVKDFRGDTHEIKGWTSGEDWSNNGGTGRVHTDKGNFFPGVVDAKIVPLKKVEEKLTRRSKLTPWVALALAAKLVYGEPDFESLSSDQASHLVDLSTANKHAYKDFKNPHFLTLKASQMQHIINKHPEFLAGKAKDGLRDPTELEEETLIEPQKMDSSVYANYSEWKQSILLSNPMQAKRIIFRGRMEGQKTIIVAGVPGEDKIYGIWDDKIEAGEVLNEAVK